MYKYIYTENTTNTKMYWMYTNIHRKHTNIQCTMLPLDCTHGETAWQNINLFPIAKLWKQGSHIYKHYTEQKVINIYKCIRNTQSELHVQQ